MAWYDAIPGGTMINSFFHPEEGYEDAAKKMQQAWEEAQRYQVPYWQQGLNQTGRLNEAENKLLDPTSLLNDWISKYEMSPMAKQNLEQSKQEGLQAASSQGLLGSSAATQNIQQSAHDVMSADREKFLQDLMQKYMTGIGIGTNMYGTGAQMGGALGQGALGVGGELGNMAYGAKNAPGDRLADILAAISRSAMQMGRGAMTGGMR